jgi:acyl-CoA thioester hydrolase
MKKNFKFLHSLRVRYAEIDGQKIVFNAHYLTYLSVALMEYLRNIKLNYYEISKNYEFDVALVKITLEYLSPAFFDEILDIGVKVIELGNSSLKINYEIFKSGDSDPIFIANAIYANFNTKTKKSQIIPDRIREKIAHFEGLL